MENFRKQLPIYKERENILKSVRDHQILIVVGETGSGKTTQVPQYLHESGAYTKDQKSGIIACTQPRRVAAVSLAQRVAEELGSGVKVGGLVGYTIRFEDRTSAQTRIKYMTDGMLLRELLNDRLLRRYSVLILDEAHERTLRTDVLFGMVKLIIRKRPQLKIVIMSATLDAETFSRYFNHAPILTIPGRMHPVRLMCTAEPQLDYMDSALVTIFQLHLDHGRRPGDILVFLTGQEEIESMQKLLEENAKHCPPSDSLKLLICPLFANLPTHQQSFVFQQTPTGCRKVVLSTNIAETSITISGIRFIVDCGLQKVRGYDPRTGMETLCVQPISKASARQRAGRAGREAPGVAYRLYTEDTFKQLRDNEVPEIQRCHLSSVILLLKASGVDDVIGFDFMSMPSRESLMKSLEELLLLEALDTQQQLTALGREMSHFPLEPKTAKVLIKSRDFGCLSECIAIIALLSVESLFFTPNDKRDEAAESRKKFTAFEGDLITLMNALEAFEQAGKDNHRQWCQDHFLNYRSLQHVLEVRKQLTDLCKQLGYFSSSAPSTAGEGQKQEHVEEEVAIKSLSNVSKYERILQAFLTGFFMNVAVRQTDGTSYKSMFTHQILHIHPSSSLFGRKADLVLYCDVIWSSRRYMRSVSRIDASWLSQASPSIFHQS